MTVIARGRWIWLCVGAMGFAHAAGSVDGVHPVSVSKDAREPAVSRAVEVPRPAGWTPDTPLFSAEPEARPVAAQASAPVGATKPVLQPASVKGDVPTTPEPVAKGLPKADRDRASVLNKRVASRAEQALPKTAPPRGARRLASPAPTVTPTHKARSAQRDGVRPGQALASSSASPVKPGSKRLAGSPGAVKGPATNPDKAKSLAASDKTARALAQSKGKTGKGGRGTVVETPATRHAAHPVRLASRKTRVGQDAHAATTRPAAADALRKGAGKGRASARAAGGKTQAQAASPKRAAATARVAPHHPLRPPRKGAPAA